MFPLRLPLFSQLSTMNIYYFYIRENYLDKSVAAFKLISGLPTCGNGVNSVGHRLEDGGVGSRGCHGCAVPDFIPSKMPLVIFILIFLRNLLCFERFLLTQCRVY